MTQEEKARAYDEAIKRAKAILKVTDNMRESLLYVSTIFPELKESEDERIRKDLIQWINEFPDTIWRGHYKKDVVAWLERQEEQNPVVDKETIRRRTEIEKAAFSTSGIIEQEDWFIKGAEWADEHPSR